MHCVGGCLSRGVSAGGGGVCHWDVCPVGCLPRGSVRGVSAWGGVGVCLGEESPRGGGGYGRPLNRMTDRCKNITLPQLRCWR